VVVAEAEVGNEETEGAERAAPRRVRYSLRVGIVARLLHKEVVRVVEIVEDLEVVRVVEELELSKKRRVI
jgi:hypothetical protein